jgi:hypothetical protein
LDYTVSDYEFGKQLFQAGKSFDHCLSEEQRDGYQDAAADATEAGLQADFSVMRDAERNGEDMDWALYWKMVDEMTAKDHNHATG